MGYGSVILNVHDGLERASAANPATLLFVF